MSTKLYKLSDNQISTSLAGESVVLNHKKGEYYTLNEVGSVVWEELGKGPRSLEMLKEVILEAYDVSEEACQKDLEILLNELVDESLVEVA
jgi:hypothetical protein